MSVSGILPSSLLCDESGADCAQNAFSRRVMRITIRAMCQKRDDLDQRIIEYRSQLYQNYPAVLVQSIRDKTQQVNSKLFQFLHQIKTQKFTNLVYPSSNLELPKDNQLAVVTIPNNLPLSEPEKSVLSKGLNFVPIAKRTDEFSVKQDLEEFLRRVQLKAFFHDKATLTALQIKTFFKNLTTANPNGLLPTANSLQQTFSSKNAGTIFLNLNSIATVDLSTSNPMEWSALLNLRKRKDANAKRPTKVAR